MVPAIAALFLLCSTATPVVPQSDARWSFENDAFAELWFHGLAVIGFHGFGPVPSYDSSP
jgi:hypothetical protein